jgi:diaminobutyrate-2-oxoglutarate transaminase
VSRAEELLRRQAERESAARTYPRRLPLAIGRARGAEVWDVDGRRWLDFFAGAGTMALGHGHPRVVEVVKAQLDQLVHGLDLPTPARDDFVTELLGTLPPALRGRMKVHVCAPTGSDAVEAAIKLCKRATGRSAVIAFSGGYHGTSAGALAVSSNGALKARLPSLMPDAHFSPYAFCRRCPLALERPACRTACAAAFESLLADDRSGVPRPAAAILEPVQGEGGSVVPDPSFVQRVRAATARAGVPLVADEIQAGLGRTGRWWSFEHFDVAPDVILSSKALGGIGLPIAAMLYRAELDVWEPGTHIGTFRGHQLALAAGAAAIRVMREEGVLENARARGAELLDGLAGLRSPLLGEARGLGLMLGVDVVDEDGAPDGAAADALRAACFERGLLVELGGREDATLRLLPPLVITAGQAREALAIVADAIAFVERGAGVAAAR